MLSRTLRAWIDPHDRGHKVAPWLSCAIAVVNLATLLAPAIGVAGSSSLYPQSRNEIGALRMAQVVQLASREDILAFGKDYQNLLASGLPDSALVDRSVAAARVYCCKDLVERVNAIWFYVPPGLSVEPGDVVEVRMGRPSGKHDPGEVNVATQVRQRRDETDCHCSWQPPNERLWMRVIYCDWMPAEGWTHKRGIGEPWLKHAERDTVR